jgi:hypothetical protein
MKFSFVIGFLFLYCHCFSQDFMLIKKAKVKEKVADFYSKKNIKTTVTETDSTITFLVSDTAYSPATIIYYFNQKGKCYKEIHMGNCQECFQKLFSDRTNQKRYSYKRTGDHQFVSKPFWNLTVIVHETQPYSFSIIHGYHNRNQQKKLYKSSVEEFSFNPNQQINQ